MIKSRFAYLAFAAAALVLSALPASAQFQQTSPVPKPTYGASIIGLVPATGATDILTLSGSATKTIIITAVSCSGTGSAGATSDIALIKRTTANTGGTSTSPGVSSFDSRTAAGTGVVKAYTVNPATLGTSTGILAALKINLPTAAGALAQPVTWSMTDFPYTFPIVLRSAAESLAINGNATFAATSSLDCSFNWIEQ